MSEPPLPYVILDDGTEHYGDTVVIRENGTWVSVVDSGRVYRYPRERVRMVAEEIEGSVAEERR
jgi:hypothetical protein